MLLLSILSLTALWVFATVGGIVPVRKLIQMREARHELKKGSAGYLRIMGRWALVLIWALIVWYLATVLGDWSVSGDFDGAVARSMNRLEAIFRLVVALWNN